MFMVLLLHANFYAFDVPEDYSFKSFLRCLAEAFTLTPVNIFVLITGFFGTRFTIRKTMNLIFQVLFCVIPISLVLAVCGIIDFDGYFFAVHKYWFINVFIALLVITPLLNAAVEKFTQKEFKTFMISFYILLFIGSFQWLDRIEVAHGYSIIWFIFLYLLGRYVRLYPPTLSKKQLIAIILVSCLCKSILIFAFQRYDYVEPFIVIQSVCTFLLFTKFEIKSNAINTIATSATMVYLINLHPAVWAFMNKMLWTFYRDYSTMVFLLFTLLLCVGVFVFAIVYDRIRQFVWKKIELAFPKKQIK